MRRGWLGILVLFIACAGKPPAPTPSGSPTPSDDSRPLPSPLPAVVARVNGQPIPLKLVETMAKMKFGEKGTIPPAKVPKVYRESTDEFVTRELLFEEAQARGIRADDKVVEQAYNQSRVRYKDDDDWKQFLGARGMSDEGFRAELRVQETVAALRRAEAEKMPLVRDDEARDFYDNHPEMFDSGERIRGRRILIKLNPVTSERGRTILRDARATGALKKLRAGVDFGKVAQEYATDPKSALRGGDFGIWIRPQFPEDAVDKVFALKPGEISDIIDRPDGFEILKVEEKLPPVKVAFDEAKERLKHLMWEKRCAESLQALALRLRSKARVELYL